MPAWTRFSVLIPGLILLIQCSAGEADKDGEEPAETAIANVSEIADAAQQYAGRTVTLDGTFQGFIVADCRFPAPLRSSSITRSDWLIRTGENCMYVTGGFAEGADPFNPEHRGRRIRITATVSRDAEGKLYLRLESGG